MHGALPAAGGRRALRLPRYSAAGARAGLSPNALPEQPMGSLRARRSLEGGSGVQGAVGGCCGAAPAPGRRRAVRAVRGPAFRPTDGRCGGARRLHPLQLPWLASVHSAGQPELPPQGRRVWGLRGGEEEQGVGYPDPVLLQRSVCECVTGVGGWGGRGLEDRLLGGNQFFFLASRSGISGCEGGE